MHLHRELHVCSHILHSSYY